MTITEHHPAEVHGTCDARFTTVRDTLQANLAGGADVGASVAVTLDGELVVDLWGGWKDEARTDPWASDTIVNVWSTTKTMTALCALLLADRGELDFDAPVARYWPEFAAAGKEHVLVRHLMSHSAGLPGWDERLRPEDLYDWDKITSQLAAQAPWWKPGTQSGYHAVSQGYLVGEVVRRITGRSLGTFFAEEIAGPLDADFFIGTPPGEDHRVARVIPPTGSAVPAGMERGSVAWRTLSNPRLRPEASWEEAWRRAEIPAANGHGHARSVAVIQSVLACGGSVDGRRLLSEAGCAKALEEQTDGVDLVLGLPVRFGLGYGLSSSSTPLGPRACYWGGFGGSQIVIDLDARLTVAYMMNKMHSGLVGDDRGASIVRTAFTSLAADRG
jgi:CubicO group peptidase (beta-lactamase class C family)